LDNATVLTEDGAWSPSERSLGETRSWLDSLLEQHAAPGARAMRERVRAAVALRREQIDAAEDLVRRRYASRGYALSWQSRRSAAPLVTLIAQSASRLIGTLSARSGGVSGLFAEQSYQAEIEGLRRAGRRVGEIIRLAIDDDPGSKAALGVLVRGAYVVTRFIHALTDVVIEVNPRHARFYERVLGFELSSVERFCSRVGAPSILMRLDLERFGERLQSLKI
jgi:hypothetical protein